MDLFSFQANSEPRGRLLADRMRPETLEEYIGQEHLIGPGKLLRRAIEGDVVSSILLFGPPGCGKTTLAHIISKQTQGDFVRLNAVDASVKDVREVIEQADSNKSLYGRKTILFLDEVHRFNSARQDALLPAVERGTIIFIGATPDYMQAIFGEKLKFPVNKRIYEYFSKVKKHYGEKIHIERRGGMCIKSH